MSRSRLGPRLMMRPARPVLVAATLLLLLPAALAQSAQPVTGEATFHALPLLHGTVDVGATEGALDLQGAAARGEPFAVGWARASGRFVEMNWTGVSEWRGADAQASPRPVELGA